MAKDGITNTGFGVKTFQAILDDKAQRAREVFGSDIDLRPTSALRKLLDISSYEDHELWKEMERWYYSGFISTASGISLDLLGEGDGRGWDDILDLFDARVKKQARLSRAVYVLASCWSSQLSVIDLLGDLGAPLLEG